MKCIATSLTQAYSEAGVEMMGAYGVLYDAKSDGTEAETMGNWSQRFLMDRAMTIAGGTSEIQRNIVAERILGLPRR